MTLSRDSGGPSARARLLTVLEVQASARTRSISALFPRWCDLGLQPVLRSLDVVVGLGLDVLDVLGVALRESFTSGPKAAFVALENGFSSRSPARRQRSSQASSILSR